MPPAATVAIEQLHADPKTIRATVADLASVLADCVAGGASVNFMHPYTDDQGRAFFEGVADEVERGDAIGQHFAQLAGGGAGVRRSQPDDLGPRAHGQAGAISPASARSIRAMVFSRPKMAAKEPKRGPWLWPSSTS